MSSEQPRTPARTPLGVHVRRWLPPLGTVALLAYLVRSTDLDGVRAAFTAADTSRTLVVIVVGTLVTWLADSACLGWLLRQTLAGRGNGVAFGLREVAPLKASSYVLNIVNYNAATLGMAWIVARRRGVGFLEATAALAVLSWLDLVALALLVTVGLQVAPDLLGEAVGLQDRLEALSAVVMVAALVSVFLLQSGLPLGPLERLRQLAVLRPLASLKPSAMAIGVALRAGFVMLYVAINHQLMVAFGLEPSLGALMVLVPVITVVGVVPLSVSGLGTTQILARTLYASFVPAGLAVAPQIDAFTTTLIVGFILARLVIALPFLGRIWRELRAATGQS